jgi:nitrogen-specific signal transduction histidine kinase
MKNKDRKTSFILFLIGILPFLYLTIDLVLVDPSNIRSVNHPNTISQIQKNLSNILYQNNYSNLFIKKQMAKEPMKHWQDYLLNYRKYFEGILLFDSKSQTLYRVHIGSVYKTKPPFNITNHLEGSKHFGMYDSINKKKWSYSKKGKNSIEDKLDKLLIDSTTKWDRVAPNTKLPLNLLYMTSSLHSKTRKYRICRLQKFRSVDENYTLIFIKKPNFLLEKIDANISESFPDYLITISLSEQQEKIKLKYHFLTDLQAEKLEKETSPLQAKLKNLQLRLKSQKGSDKKSRNLIVSDIENITDKLGQNNYLLRKKQQLDIEKLYRYKVLETESHGYTISLYDNKSAWFRARVEKLISKPSWQLMILFLCPIIILVILFYRYAKKDENYLLQNDWVDYLAHEIQTPVHGISICAELLLNSRDEKLVKLINNQATHLSYVAKTFVRSVQTQKFQLLPKKEKADFHEVLQNSWAMISKVHEDKDPKLSLKIDEAEILLDSKMFQEVFINLFDNSCKYCEGSPKISVEIKNVSGGVDILVHDNGIGIEQMNFKKVLQKSFRIQNQWNLGVTGTGMGLYLINEMVSSHQGTFTISQSGSEGTTFKIHLPS